MQKRIPLPQDSRIEILHARPYTVGLLKDKDGHIIGVKATRCHWRDEYKKETGARIVEGRFYTEPPKKGWGHHD